MHGSRRRARFTGSWLVRRLLDLRRGTARSSGGYGRPSLTPSSAIGLLAVLCTALLVFPLPNLPPAAGEGTPVASSADGRNVADWKILGLDTREYATRIVPRLALSGYLPERQWVRHYKILVTWGKVQPKPGVWRWSYFDQEINACLADGAQSIMLLLHGGTPEWARDPAYGEFADKAPPRDMRWWYDFCAAVAQRYGSVVDFYEIWNEPGWDRDSTAWYNYGVYHFGGQVETEYLPLLQLAYQAIKEKDPSGIVLSGDMQCVNDPHPDRGTELYALLFDDVNRPGQDVSVKVEADQPIVAERPMYFNYAGAWAGGHDSLGAVSPQADWYFAEGCTRPGFHTYLCLQNPGDSPATVDIDYYCGDGATVTKRVNVGRRSRYTVAVHGEAEGIGVHDDVHGDVSIRVRSSLPIVAERPMYFNYGGKRAGGHDSLGADTPRKDWYFAEGCTGYSLEEYLCLQNPNESEAKVAIHCMMQKGETLHRTLSLPARSRTTINLNYTIGFNGSCDMISMHPYKLPQDWGRFYTNVVNALCSKGVRKELVVAEVGWPHYKDGEPGSYSEQGQAEAMGSVGIGSLIQNGCRKIWVYQMMDEDPGTSWDQIYCGLFSFNAIPFQAWYVYRNWQQTYFPSYPSLPPSLP